MPASQQYQPQLMRFAGTEIASCNSGRTACTGRPASGRPVPAHSSRLSSTSPTRHQWLPTCPHRHPGLISSYPLQRYGSASFRCRRPSAPGSSGPDKRFVSLAIGVLGRVELQGRRSRISRISFVKSRLSGVRLRAVT